MDQQNIGREKVGIMGQLNLYVMQVLDYLKNFSKKFDNTYFDPSLSRYLWNPRSIKTFAALACSESWGANGHDRGARVEV